MLPDDLIATADTLLAANVRRPRQSDLRRAVSTVYYAMFHTLAKCCADLLVGGSGSQRSKPAWKQVYRALEHGTAKNACSNKKLLGKFPAEIQHFGNQFVQMQVKRHSADYDPDQNFYKTDVLIDIAVTEFTISEFKKVPLKDRRAFAAFVLLKQPRS